MIERCRCGSRVVMCHQTMADGNFVDRWRVECVKNGEHFGPWHDTRLAAVRAWNKKRRARKSS